MTDIPLVDFAVAATVGGRLIPAGPHLSARETAGVVTGLRDAAAASVEPIAEVTRLTVPAGGDMPVVDRATWVRLNCAMAHSMLREAFPGGRTPANPGERREARANGVQIGAALALVGTKILGQYLPFAAEPQLILVAPNVAKVERALHVDPDDFRLWVCLHEQTHRLQFAQAPWLRGHLIGKVAELLAGEDHDPGLRLGALRSGSLLDAVTTPEQRVIFDEVSGVMALLEGYADVMMDRVGPDVVPTVATIRRLFDARRARGGLAGLMNKALGMDLKFAQYRDGAAFCRTVLGAVGVDGLNAVYTASGQLPSLAEISDPPAWVARVHG